VTHEIFSSDNPRDSEELSLLGAMMINPDIVHDISSVVKVKHFSNHITKAIYLGILECLESEGQVDILLVNPFFKKQFALKNVNIPVFIADLMHTVPSSANAMYYAKRIVKRYSLDLLSDEIKKAAKSLDGADIPDFEAVVSEVAGITERIPVVPSDEDTMEKVLEDFMEDIRNPERSANRTGNRINSGITTLDEMLPDLGSGKVLTVGGRTSHGKTVLCTNYVKNTLMEDRKTVVFTYELERRAYIDRLAAVMLNMSVGKISRPHLLNEDERQQLESVENLLSVQMKNLFVYEYPTAEEIFTRLIQHRPDLVVIDYLQAWAYSENASTNDEKGYRGRIAEFMGRLKKFSLKYRTCIIVASQLRRISENKEGYPPPPRRTQCLEASAIEQHTDYVILPYWPDKDHAPFDESEQMEVENNLSQYAPHGGYTPQQAYYEIIVDKNRNGETGTVPCTIIPHSGQIYSHTARSWG
jgi:replicative DNA helicase